MSGNTNNYHDRYYFEPDSNDSILFQKLYLHGFDISIFKSRWEKFIQSDFNSADDRNIQEAIREVMTFYNRVTEQNYYNIPTWSYHYKKGQIFYRVRKINGSENNIPPLEMGSWGDLWEPPASKITKYGRLNYPYESVLYTSVGNPLLAIKETRLKDGDCFALITYEAVEDIFPTIVGIHRDNDALTIEENQKNRILSEFFSELFSQEISSESEEHLYRITASLIKECYTFEGIPQDGWVYPSIVNKKGHNVCFRPEAARNKLKVQGVELCKVDTNYGFLIFFVLDNLDEVARFTYHGIGSDVQIAKYPLIKVR